MIEVRYRNRWRYVNDLAGYTEKIPEVVFGFTLEELYALESWVPLHDGFHKEVTDAIEEMEKRNLARVAEALKADMEI